MKGRPEPWLERLVLVATGARTAGPWWPLQSLWSGYGEIQRVELDGYEHESVIVKHVAPPSAARRWDDATRRSHARKLRSYAVEMAWYQSYAPRLGAECRVPRLLGSVSEQERWVFVLEDLDRVGYSGRRRFLGAGLDAAAVERCLVWLARFHATFLGSCPEGLWATGTYWHLDTRPDELLRMTRTRLQSAATALDVRLKSAKFQSFVHGDAKVDNFCFGAEDADAAVADVAAVDFQYVGGGVGVKDIAYFFSSIWGAAECEGQAADALDYYFGRLREALSGRLTPLAADALEQEWRALYPVAWADFYRFLDGWAPGHAEDHAYSERMLHQALANP